MNDSYVSLEGLIREVAPSLVSPYAKKKQKLKEWLITFEREKQRFDQITYNSLARVHDNNEATRYVHEAQWIINNLVDMVIRYQSNFGLPLSIKTFYESINLLLTDTLDILVRRFKPFFNPSIPLPYAYSIMKGKQLERKVRQVREDLSKTRVNKHMLSIALKPLERRVEEPAGITYRESDYYMDLCNSLQLINKEPAIESYMLYDYKVISAQLREATVTEQRINIILHILLFHFNFNSPDYISFCIAGLQKRLASLQTNSEKLKVLRLYLKLMNQVIIRPGSSLVPEATVTANKQVKKWLEEEINYLPPQVMENGHSPAIEKIDTSLSSGELAVFITLFTEGKIITDTNKAKIYRSFAALFTTVGSDSLSADSLRSKAANKKSSSIEKVRGKIWDCFNIIREW
jgi:hypothetical protein